MVEKILVVSSVAKIFLPKQLEGYQFIYGDKNNYKQLLKDVDYVIAGEEPYTNDTIKGCSRLKLISRCGHGTDNITQNTIPIRDCRGCLDTTIAELTLCYMIMGLRMVKQLDSKCHSGNWERLIGNTLYGKTVGIIGYGGIGSTLGKLLEHMGVKVLHYDIIPCRCNCKLDHLLGVSDIITLHCDLNPSSRHIINKNSILRMKKDIVLINTSRGPVIDTGDLLIYHRRFRCIVLDVFEEEPLPTDSGLFGCGNIVFGVHSASNSMEGLEYMAKRSLANIVFNKPKGIYTYEYIKDLL